MTSFFSSGSVVVVPAFVVILNWFQDLVVQFSLAVIPDALNAVIPECSYRGSPPYSYSQAVGIPDYNFRE